MPYSQFTTLDEAIEKFSLTLHETTTPIIDSTPIAPSSFLQQLLDRELTWAISVGTEKARSEALILQVLLEVREHHHKQISVFSGRSFDVNESVGLGGYCDFLISQSSQQTVITAPVVAIVEAKRGDLTLGWGQCAAEMVAALQFNEQRKQLKEVVYGAVSTGTLWQFLKLEGEHLTLNVEEYTLPPVAEVLGVLVAMTNPSKGK